jgi:hypothetical protein
MSRSTLSSSADETVDVHKVDDNAEDAATAALSMLPVLCGNAAVAATNKDSI